MQSPSQSGASSGAAELAGIAAATLEALRAKAPRVHCITNTVAQAFTANVLLAAGAVPAMTASPEEVGAFVAMSGALLVNIGTLDRERRVAIDTAVEAAVAENIPWVLDPVFIDRVPFRAELAHDLIERGNRALRLNAAEFRAISGADPTPRNVAQYARQRGTVVALTGATDVVADATRQASVSNGHPWMAKVTAVGCANSALVAACIAVEPDPWKAALSAVLIGGIAGEIGARHAQGPGTFPAAYVDAISTLDAAAIASHARVQ
ncbi:MAG: hydroxyethylthiazole kinase [Xanthobacteraceae bacterium]|uniref:hydroxyethylthiazole kinase n=1 Tax=Pseudolabrys sp. TaxID=1960880 RepID=UPI003D0BE355